MVPNFELSAIKCFLYVFIPSFFYVSNTLGTINPIKTIIDQAHEKGAIVRRYLWGTNSNPYAH